MNAQMLLQSFAGGDDEKTYVDDVFSTYLYTGNGSTQTITDNIDRAKGALDIFKGRSGVTDWAWYDTARGVQKDLASNLTSAETVNAQGVTATSRTGVMIGSLAKINTSGSTYVKTTFRRAKKFFDIVTYTGNGVAGRRIPHGLGVAPGMMIVKRYDDTGSWIVYHKSTGATKGLVLNEALTGTVTSTYWNDTNPTDTVFTIAASNNLTGAQYVAYLFAHDDSKDGFVQCGSVTTTFDGTTYNGTVNLGWEPQYVLIKNASSNLGWYIEDSMRGMTDRTSSGTKYLEANFSATEGDFASFGITSTGFEFKGGFGAGECIYLAIRRPNKPPTSGTEVYNAIARTGTSINALVAGVNFPVDTLMVQRRTDIGITSTRDRLRGNLAQLNTASTSPEAVSNIATINFDVMDGVSISGIAGQIDVNNNSNNYINHFFRRATGFFDVVCDTGTGSAHAINHNLTVAPELVIRKSRSAATQWEVWHSALAATEKLVLNATAAKAADATAFGTLPTATQFYVGASSNTNASAATYVTYLFATCPGVSKVFSFTGNGTSLPIDCGFTSGARFVLIKHTDSTGDWYVWDSARGIVAANDPHLSLNTSAAEVTTDDSVDPYAGGFIVNQNTATNINITGKRYIFLAIA